MKKTLLCLLLCALLCAPVYAVSDAPENAARSCILVCLDGGRVLYEKNADEFLPIASTTKIMTAMLVLEACDLADEVVIPPECADVEGSRMELTPGDTASVEDLLYGLMLQSGNDAAIALAVHAAGSVEAFAEQMNEKCAALGLMQTHYVNPHGLDAEGQGSTARELALIAQAAMEDPTFRRIVSTERKTIGDKTYVNHNRLLRTYPGAVGVKTGYTMAAGRILVSCAERAGMRLLCVTISDPDDWADHTALLDWGFQEYQMFEGEGISYVLPVFSGEAHACAVVPEQTPRLLLRAGETPRIRAALPRFVFAPLRRGQTLGTLTLTAPDGTEAAVPLVCAGAVPADAALPLSFPEKLARFWRLAGRALFSFNLQI